MIKEKRHEGRSEPTPCPEAWPRFFEEVSGEFWLVWSFLEAWFMIL